MPVPTKYVLTEPWVIRDKSGTGMKFIHGKSVNLESGFIQLYFPRMFKSERSARAFLDQWCRGRMSKDPNGRVVVIPMPHRVKADMEIIQLQLVRVP